MVRTLKAKKMLYCSQVCHAWCCRNLIVKYDSNDPDDDKFFTLRCITWDKEKKELHIPCKCKWVDNHNKCRLYSWRPNACRVYECDKLKSMTVDS